MSTFAKSNPRDVSWESLERDDWHLWILAGLLLLVLGIGLLSFMLPSVILFREGMPLHGVERVPASFGLLMLLAMAYMLQRQVAVRRLKRQLFATLQDSLQRERNALVELFESLPAMALMRDALSVEFRRAKTSGGFVALLIFQFHTSAPPDSGRLARMLRGMLRRGEGLFRVSESALGLVLPNTSMAEAQELAAHAVDSLNKECPDATVSARISAFPEEAQSYSEMEATLLGRAA